MKMISDCIIPYCLRSWDFVLGYPREVKWFWQRRINGFSDCDLWNLDHHLAKIILSRLMAFKKYPRMAYKVLDGIELDEVGTPECGEEEAIRRWEEVLDKMIFSFDCIANRDYDDDLYEEYLDNYGKWDREKRNGYMIEMGPTVEQRYNEIQEGLDLFGKHFSALWD